MESIITILIVGLIAGALARLLVPGKDPMGILGTLILGLVGSAIGGLVVNLVSGESEFGVAGILGSTIGAIVALLVYRSLNGKKASKTA